MIVTRGFGGRELVTFGYGRNDSLYVGIAVVAPTIDPHEPKPITVWTLEGKPPDGYSIEPVPTRPPAQDGFYTEPVLDGAYDEFPLDGFYAPVGYFKEFKPFHRATMTKEGIPVASSTKEGKPN